MSIRDADALPIPGQGARPEHGGEVLEQSREAVGGRGWGRWALGGVFLAGVALTIALILHFGWRSIASSVGALGLAGFAVFCGYTLLVFVLLGWSWFVIAPDLPYRRLPAFVFGRLMREAAADTLPFSQLGGFVAGARAATLLGAPATISVATSVVDLGAEMLGQLLFTAVGVAIIAQHAPKGFPHRILDPVLAVGLVVGLVTAGLFIFSQQTGLKLLDRFSTRWPASMKTQLSSMQEALQSLYRRPARPLISVAAHFGCWIAAMGGVWIVLRFMGAPLSFPTVIAMESLIYLLRSAAFFIPGAIGVLEGGYILLGPVFGLHPEVALGLSLIKRGRDFALGLPAVLVWQLLEGRRLLGRR
ncbi:MAG: lysylphosphatidylglycerol synthase domain-containing protein [Caulobacteraceae bacterium]